MKSINENILYINFFSLIDYCFHKKISNEMQSSEVCYRISRIPMLKVLHFLICTFLPWKKKSSEEAIMNYC